MNRVLKWIFTWSFLAVGLSTSVEWKLSDWDKWDTKPVKWEKTLTWDVWFTDVLPWVGTKWDKLVWDWTPSSKVEYELKEGHELSRFVSFYDPHKWVAAWVTTWFEGNLWETFLLWEKGVYGWSLSLPSAHDWATHVVAAWPLTKMTGNELDKFKTLPVSLPTLWVAGHGHTKLSLANKWAPSWHWHNVEGVWTWHSH